MSWLGVLAGMGDAVGEENRRREEQSRADRDNFINSLMRVAESEDWPEQARAAAYQGRMQVLSNPKIKPKDYEKIWGGVLQASQRQVSGAADRNAQRSNVPA